MSTSIFDVDPSQFLIAPTGLYHPISVCWNSEKCRQERKDEESLEIGMDYKKEMLCMYVYISIAA